MSVIAPVLAAAHLALAAAPAPGTRIEADEVQYLYRERRAIMTGRPLVTLTREGARLTCRRLVAEYDEAGALARAACEGDVKLVAGQREITCGTARYDAAAGQVVCSGDPVLRDGASELRAQEIAYDLAGERVVARQGRATLFPRLPAPPRGHARAQGTAP